MLLNLVQHLMKSMDYETLKRVQGDVLGVLGQPLCPYFSRNAILSPAEFPKVFGSKT